MRLDTPTRHWFVTTYHPTQPEAQAVADRIHDTTGCETRVGTYRAGLDAYPVEVWTGPPGTSTNSPLADGVVNPPGRYSIHTPNSEETDR